MNVINNYIHVQYVQYKVKSALQVSPANSFGFMDGGIDMVYSRHFGWQM